VAVIDKLRFHLKNPILGIITAKNSHPLIAKSAQNALTLINDLAAAKKTQNTKRTMDS